jgi:outer membrane protein
MKYLLVYLIIILVLSNFNTVKAQPVKVIKQWNIEQCIAYAAAHNIQITTLRLNQLYVAQDLYLSKGAKIPGVNGTAGNTFNNANNDAAGNGHLVNQLSSTASYAVNTSIVLWNGNYINNTIQQNNLVLQSAGLSVLQSGNTITLSVTQAYLNILLAKENLKYVTDLDTASAAMVRQGQLFYDAGSVAKINLLQLQAQYASDQLLLVQTENAIRQNLLVLKQLLQLPADSLFDIVSPLGVDVIEILPSLQNVQQTALQNFPEIKIGQLGMDIASLDIEKARAGFKPVLSANAAIGSGYSDVITNSYYAKAGYFTQTGNNFYQRAGLSLSIPIFSNHTNSVNLAKAKIGYRQAALNLQNYQLVLSQAIEQVYITAYGAIQAYTAANEQLVAAKESFRIINEQYKLGGTNSFEVLQLRNQYVQAVQSYTQAKYTAVLQYKIYQFYLGNPVTL